MNQLENVSFEEGSTNNQPEKATEGSVVSLHISSSADTPMTALTVAHVVPGRGIEGDRFYLRRGIGNTEYDRFTCDVTLIEEETIQAMKRQEHAVDSGDSARRNIVVRNCSLDQLVDRTFRIGDVTLRGLAPRSRDIPASAGEEQIEPTLVENSAQASHCLVLPRPDLRASVLTEGSISIGDRIELI
jgi:MOSC domain-containing protein YiiM